MRNGCSATLLGAVAVLLLQAPQPARADCVTSNAGELRAYQTAFKAGQAAQKRGDKAGICRHLGSGVEALQRFESALAQPTCAAPNERQALADVRKAIADAKAVLAQCPSDRLPDMRTERAPAKGRAPG